MEVGGEFRGGFVETGGVACRRDYVKLRLRLCSVSLLVTLLQQS